MELPPRWGNWNGNVDLANGAHQPACHNSHYNYYQSLIKKHMERHDPDEPTIEELAQDAPEPTEESGEIPKEVWENAKELHACVDYCEQTNGLPHCKNCGLDRKMIGTALTDAVQAYRKELVERASKLEKVGNNGEGLPFENSPEIYGNQRQEAYKRGYNSALDDILRIINEQQ